MMPCVLRIYHGGDTWRVGAQRTPSRICRGLKNHDVSVVLGIADIFWVGFLGENNDGAVKILAKVVEECEIYGDAFFFLDKPTVKLCGAYRKRWDIQIMAGICFIQKASCKVRVVPVPKIIWKEDEMMVQWVLWKSYPKLWRFTLQGINISRW